MARGKAAKLKVVTIVGTRPEIIKLSRVIAELDKRMDHVLVHTGQNFDYELNQIFFDDLGIRKPDHFLNAAGESAADTIGNVIAASDKLFAREKPDALLLLGDTNSCLAVIPAKRRHIPIFHMEAGNRCFDVRVPEEINRRIVDHTSDINLVYTEHARRYLIAEGVRPETIIKTGSPMREVLAHHEKQIAKSDVLKRLKLKPKGYFVVSAHREENVDTPARLAALMTSLKQIRAQYKMPVVMSVHPRTAQQMEKGGKKFVSTDKDLRLLKPLGFFDYVRLQKDAYCVLSDSGTLTEEASILDFPGVMLREAHERPEGMDVGSVVMAGLNPVRIMQAIDLVVAQRKTSDRSFAMAPDYEATDVSRKVVRVIQSYRDYVMRTVWREQTP
ncbi:MAG: non-hydrolyzing UDP-N-acetylglucosamine 2-epimerase [Rhizomicrobium sp.]